MVTQLQPSSGSNLIYPESDGKPIADNTEQFRWIVTLHQNLDWLFASDPTVFVAGDLLWYPVEGSPSLCTAPDVMVAFGRPKGKRGSYKQWEENNIAPQVVFEILSPSNTLGEMNKKQSFYNRYGVEEYYIYNPDTNDLSGWLRRDNILDVIDPIADWVSPRLGIRFAWSTEGWNLYRPDGQRFLTYIEIAEAAEQAKQQAEQAKQQAERLAQKLRDLGVDPEQI